MRVHHLNCGSLCPHGARLFTGEGGLLERAEIICHCLLIEADDGLILVDTGFGLDDARNPRQLGQPFRALFGPRPRPETTAVRRLEELGFAPADVRNIVTTHLDVDHAGGLPDFPAAKVHLLAAELDAALRPRLDERLRYIGGAHWRHNPCWVEHEAGGDDWFGFESVRILPDVGVEIALVPLAGHSRGHTAVAVSTGEGWLLHCGDAYFHRGEVETPPSSPVGLRLFQSVVASDNKARRANQERLRELAREHGDRVTLVCAHDPYELAREQAAAVPAAA